MGVLWRGGRGGAAVRELLPSRARARGRQCAAIAGVLSLRRIGVPSVLFAGRRLRSLALGALGRGEGIQTPWGGRADRKAARVPACTQCWLEREVDLHCESSVCPGGNPCVGHGAHGCTDQRWRECTGGAVIR